MHTVFDNLNTLGVYLNSKNFYWAFILEGEFYVEEDFISKTFLQRANCFTTKIYKMSIISWSKCKSNNRKQLKFSLTGIC